MEPEEPKPTAALIPQKKEGQGVWGRVKQDRNQGRNPPLSLRDSEQVNEGQNPLEEGDCPVSSIWIYVWTAWLV